MKGNSKSIKNSFATESVQLIFSIGKFKSTNVDEEEFKKGLFFVVNEGYII